MYQTWEKRSGDLGISRPPLQRVKENIKEAALSKSKNRKALYRQNEALLLWPWRDSQAPVCSKPVYTLWEACLGTCLSTVTDAFCPPIQERKHLVSQHAPGVWHLGIIHSDMHIKCMHYIHHKNLPSNSKLQSGLKNPVLNNWNE